MKSRLKYFIPLLLMFVFTACNRPDCNNGRKDGDEREIDCGGACPDCPPSVTTKPVSSVATTTATLSMDYYHTTGTSKSSEGFIEKGFCYGTAVNPTKDNSVTSTTGTFNASGDYTTSITGLTGGTTYHVRAYIKDKTAIAYGNDVTFTTSSLGITVITDSVTAVSLTTATCGGTVTSTNGISIVVKGVCYSTSPNPTIASSTTVNGGLAGTFTANLTGLASSTTYYIRAYANYSGGTVYGNERSFTTTGLSLPTVTTTSSSSISTTSAIVDGNVTATGGTSVTARGICYNTSPNPTIANNKTTNGSGLGTFSSGTISGLSPNTTYYARAYATNSIGTAYGNQITFITLSISLPTVITSLATSIANTSASSGGNVTNDGGSNVTSRGICYSPIPNPTTSNSTILSGSGLGAFASNLTGLTGGITYYVRAFATNSAGTSYGGQISFTTSLVIGQNYGGGKIAYIDGSGIHGLIVSSLNQSAGIAWYNGSNVVTGATATQVGDGQNNTNLIISIQGNTGSYAAKLCQDLVIGSYSDWYLPSFFELQKLYDNKLLIGGFMAGDYWSSSEWNFSNARVINFTNGTTGNSAKNTLNVVRAIRSF